MKVQAVVLFVVWTIFTWVSGVTMGVTFATLEPNKARSLVDKVHALDSKPVKERR